MLGAVPIGTWLTFLIYILPSAFGREGIPRTEDGLTSKGSHQPTIPFLHLAQLFRHIVEFVALDINLELLEASELCRQFTCELIVLKTDSHKLLRCGGILQEISRYGTSEDIAI